MDAVLKMGCFLLAEKVLPCRGILQVGAMPRNFYFVGFGMVLLLVWVIFPIIGMKFIELHMNYNALTNIPLGSAYLVFSFYLMFLQIKKPLKTNTK